MRTISGRGVGVVAVLCLMFIFLGLAIATPDEYGSSGAKLESRGGGYSRIKASRGARARKGGIRPPRKPPGRLKRHPGASNGAKKRPVEQNGGFLPQGISAAFL